MKDYSDYYSSQNDIINDSANYIFSKKLDTNEGFTVDIDNITNVKVVIQEHTNPLNEDKEDRKIIIPSNISFHRGSIVKWKDRDWIIINNVGNEDNNGIYTTAKIYPCNNTLKYILPSDRTQIITIPCISSNMSLYSIGLDETKQVVTSDGKKFITIPLSNQTKEIFVGQRFLFWDKTAYEVTEISSDKTNLDSLGNRYGVLEIKMQQSQIQSEDDLINSLAFNKNVLLETPINPTDLVINGSDKLYLSKIGTYTVSNADGSPTSNTFTFSIDNISLATIQSTTDTSCVLLGDKVNKGYITITATANEDNSIVVNKIIWIRSLI